MQKIFYFTFIALLFSCSTNKGEGVIDVKASFPEVGTNFVSWLDIFPDIEMIPLTGEQAPMLSPQACRLSIHNGDYYVADPSHTQKTHRFDQNGKYLNSIGVQGRGPEEYTSILDFMVDDQGNVVIHPYGEDVLVIYSQDGTFLERRELPLEPYTFFSFDGFDYNYVGVVGDGSQLYVTDNSGQVVGEFLPQLTSVPYWFSNIHMFSAYDNGVNFCPAEDNSVYRLKDGKMEVKYRFDFGDYAITDEYYKKDMDALSGFLLSNTIAYKGGFLENGHCAVLYVAILGKVNPEPFWPTFVMGVLDKKKDLWKWFGWDDYNSMQTPLYFDEEYTYILASAELMREMPGLTERFPLLNTVTESNDTVILKCKTKSIKL